MVRLTDAELARLDEFRSSGLSRPAFIRSLLLEPPRDGDHKKVRRVRGAVDPDRPRA